MALDISMSLDGFIAGPTQTLDEPLGKGGQQLHKWAFATRSFRESHGLEGGETTVDSEVVDELLGSTGATVMGRRMFSGGRGAWEDDPNADAWWGDEPPFHHPVFVLTHHPREPLAKEGGTTFTLVTAEVSGCSRATPASSSAPG
jgi:dihydrofolate reductase